jgi:membrane-bound lytic murein transglycosylase A
MGLRPFAASLAVLLLAACATAPPEPGSGRSPIPSPFAPAPSPPPAPGRTMELSALPGWAQEDHAGAFAAYRATCHAAREPGLSAVCRRARALPSLDDREARLFFETSFRAEVSPPAGTLTAYFAPEYEARHQPDGEFSAAVRPKPADLMVVDAGLFDPGQAGRPGAARDPGDGPLQPYPDRAGIETTPPDAVLAWMRPEELFFLQIQGSGVLTFEDGDRRKALYAANNGRPFAGVANTMRDQGLLAADKVSGDSIRAWLAAHRGPAADTIMRLNPRYAFFNLAPDDGLEPVGAAGVPLPAGRAIAIDPAFHAMGELYWLDAEAPILAGAFPTYRRLVTALDTGGAIKGDVRADLYLGTGAIAGAEAGRVRHRLRMYRLIPRAGEP